VNFAVNDGWFIDLPMTSERSDTDSQLALGTLAFTTNVLNPSACTVGGSSWLNFVDYRTGGSVSQNGMVSVSLGQSLALRVELVKLPNRQVHALTRKTDSTIDNRQVNVNPSRTTRRVGWRELVKE
jgi:type IV pilus assembly protein PilY1